MTSDPILIRRYALTRLYYPAAGRYVSLEELRTWRDAGIPFQVHDAGSGTDVTRVLLA